jgi:ATP-binding cassette subfamily F protein 3
MLLRPANCLLLDEPTNHLDLQAKEVLLEALRQYTGTVIFVSHDRAFIDGLANKIIHVTPAETGGGVELYPGNYEEYRYHAGLQADGTRAAAPQAAAAPSAAPPSAPKARINPQRQQALKKAVSALEAEIATVEEEVKALEAALADEATFRDAQLSQTTLARYKTQSDRRAALYTEWEEKTASLAAL